MRPGKNPEQNAVGVSGAPSAPGSAAEVPPARRGTLAVKRLVKHFGPVKANDGVDLELHSGEIHAILGENGAGKSTLLKILAGVYRADSGEITLDGQHISIDSPARARGFGVAIVHQQAMLVPRLTIAENVALQDGALGRLDPAVHDRLVEGARRLGFELDPATPVEHLTLGQRQRVEIARAVMTDAKFLILDEPTAVLAPAERDGLFALLRSLADEGVAVAFVTHHLDEAIEHSDRMTVLRAGTVAGEIADPTGSSKAELIQMMVGEVVSSGRTRRADPGEEVVVVEDASGAPAWGRRLEGVSLRVRAREILGVAGVEGNGQRELSAMLTGAWTPDDGTVELSGIPLASYPPERRARLVADVPDEAHLATCDDLSIWENVALTRMAWLERRSPAACRRFRQFAAGSIRDFGIRAPSVETPVGRLSGGNRRRVVLARELSKQPALAVLTYAAHGLDVRSQEQLKDWARRLAEGGAAVVYISSDLEEVFDVSDRIAVISRGRITGIVDAAEASAERVGALMVSEVDGRDGSTDDGAVVAGMAGGAV